MASSHLTRRISWLGAGILAGMTIAVHSSALSADLVSDDVLYVVQNPSVSRFGDGWTEPFPAQLGPRLGLYRPLTVLSYQLDHLAFGSGAAGFHLSSLLLASFMTVTVYFLLAALGSPMWSAFAGAAVFAMHPVHVECIAWVSGRSELLAFVLGLIGFLLTLRARRGPTLPFSLGAALALFAAAASKESGFLWLGVLVAHEMLFPSGTRRDRAFRLLLPGIALAVLWLLRAQVLGGIGPQGQQQAFGTVAGFDRVLLGARILVEALQLSVWPTGLSVHHPESDFTGGGLMSLLLALGIVAAVALACCWRRTRLLGFGGVVFLVLLFPFLHVIPIGESFAERFLLGPSLGMVLIVVAALAMAPRTVRAGATVVVLSLASASAVSSFRQTETWQSEGSLWARAAEVHPDDPDVLFGRAYSAIVEGEDLELAIELLTRLTRDFPQVRPPEVLFNLGYAYEARGELELAANYYRLCAQRYQSDATFWAIERLLNLAASGQVSLTTPEAASLWTRLRATIRDPGRLRALAQRYQPLFQR
ncbi:MAG: tetratricopeptide repeat protein [Planctomycetota bacterium]